MNKLHPDMMLIYYEDAMNNHKNNMLNTFKKMQKLVESEKKTLGDSESQSIYGDALENYVKHFTSEREKKNREAEHFRMLAEYLRGVTQEEEEENSDDNSSYNHKHKHAKKEAQNIAKELTLVNTDIEELNKYIKS